MGPAFTIRLLFYETYGPGILGQHFLIYRWEETASLLVIDSCCGIPCWVCLTIAAEFQPLAQYCYPDTLMNFSVGVLGNARNIFGTNEGFVGECNKKLIIGNLICLWERTFWKIRQLWSIATLFNWVCKSGLCSSGCLVNRKPISYQGLIGQQLKWHTYYSVPFKGQRRRSIRFIIASSKWRSLLEEN